MNEPTKSPTPVRVQPVVMPPIVCLCGSTRFVDAFNEWRKRLTNEGKIVLSIEIVTSQAAHEDPQHVAKDLKAMLDELHLRKIDLATEVLVLNVGGYIGESTAREIRYASEKQKPIRLLEPYLTPESRQRLGRHNTEVSGGRAAEQQHETAAAPARPLH